MAEHKKSVLIIGGGAVGAIAAVNLEAGGLASVTLVLRSNFDVVNTNGYHIESCDHGTLPGWKPTYVHNTIPDITKEDIKPYDYIVVTTKNIPDIGPSVADLIAPALPPDNEHTTIVLLQNGLNIEKPVQAAYPRTQILSGVSMVGSNETDPGTIIQDGPDKLLIGPFARVPEATLSTHLYEARAREFVYMYGKAGRTECVYSANVKFDRWRKLVYNACLNPICAITGLDTGRIRLVDGGNGLVGLVRPAMMEVVAAARACGVDLMEKENVMETMIEADELECYLKPSMLVDVEKGNYIEVENLLGEPLREGKKHGVSMPTLEVLYQLAKAIQWRTKERRGVVEIPPRKTT